MKSKKYFAYIMASKSRTLNVGVTNNLERRVHEHKRGLLLGFTSRYRVSRLVYFEATENVGSAIARERQIKGWRREKKVALIEACNPAWEGLSAEWLEGEGKADPSLPLAFARPFAPRAGAFPASAFAAPAQTGGRRSG